jgi:L-asparagine transporter-like permease
MKVFLLYKFNSTCNTLFKISSKYFGANQLWLDTMKVITIFVLGYFGKHHVLIHFGLRYHKGITHDQKDGVKLQCCSQGIPKMLSG